MKINENLFILGFRGGAGTMVVGKVPPWTAVRQLSRKTRKVHSGRPGLDQTRRYGQEPRPQDKIKTRY